MKSDEYWKTMFVYENGKPVTVCSFCREPVHEINGRRCRCYDGKRLVGDKNLWDHVREEDDGIPRPFPR